MTAQAEEREIRGEWPVKLQFLFERWRYKSLDSGRGASKSWSVADALLLLGFDATVQGWRADDQPLRVVCARETMASLKESVYKLLCDRIQAMGLGSDYEVQKATILGRKRKRIPGGDGFGRTEFVFTGLGDPESLKSLEGGDILWLEEAQKISKASWTVIVPTLRKEGVDALGPWSSEIWLTWNPHFDTDETYLRFKVDPPANAKCVTLSWHDNPWFPRILELERLECLRTDPVGYRNIWGGETRSSVEGAIFEKELQAAAAANPPRIGSVPRDRTKPVDTAWDLGFGDKNAIWFFQAIDGWYRMIDYLEDSGRTIEWYTIQLQNKGYVYGTHWLPHDAVDAIIHSKLGAGDKARSIEMILRSLCPNVKIRIAPKLHVTDRINAARMIFPECQFDQVACKDGLQALRKYQWGPMEPNKKTGAIPLARVPLHNEASHGSDAYQTFAVVAKQPKQPDPPRPPRPQARPASAWT